MILGGVSQICLVESSVAETVPRGPQNGVRSDSNVLQSDERRRRVLRNGMLEN